MKNQKSIVAISIILFLLMPAISFGQNSEINRTTHWFFGDGIHLDFSSGMPIVDSVPGFMQREAGAVMTDTSGIVLFYTNGDIVFNSQNQQMPNGFDIGGGAYAVASSSNGVVTVPLPGSNHLFYIFTVSDWGTAGVYGLRYSLVDMSLNGGLGDVTTKAVPLQAPSSEQLNATRHCNGTDWWIVSHSFNSNTFYAFLLTANGISLTPVATSIGFTPPYGVYFGNIGCSAFSPNGEKFALVNIKLGAQLFDFDLNTGVMSNVITLATDSQYYGVCFSPDNSKLYLSYTGVPQTGMHISQFDLTLNDSLIIVNSQNHIFDTCYFCGTGDLMGMQIGRDAKIYVATYNYFVISCIQQPNNLGASCNFTLFSLNTINNCKENFDNINTCYYIPDSLECTTGINEPKTNSFSIYPNPTSDKVSLRFGQNNILEKILLFNNMGTLLIGVYPQTHTEYTLNIAGLPEGIYFLKILINNNYYSTIIIKQ